MDRNELLRHGLQAQRARIALENQERQAKLVKAYDAVADLNFLGVPPIEMVKHVPSSFLRGSYSHHKLPAVDLDQVSLAPNRGASHEIATMNIGNMGAKPSPAPIPQPAMPPLTKSQKKKKKKKGEPRWDSEWVAPQAVTAPKVRFGDNNWSSRMVIDLAASSEDEMDQTNILEDPIEAERRRADLNAHLAKLHIRQKAAQNRLQQLHANLQKQQDAIDQERNQLLGTVEELNKTNVELAMIASTPKRRRESFYEPRSIGRAPKAAKPAPAVERAPKAQEYQVVPYPALEKDVERAPVVATPSSATGPVATPSANRGPSSGLAVGAGLNSSGVPTAPAITGADASGQPSKGTLTGTAKGPSTDTYTHSAPRQPPAQTVPVVAESQGMPRPTSGAHALRSPLRVFSSYRLNKMFVGNDPIRVYSPTYNGAFVKDAEMCEVELGGKACEKEGCKYAHFAEYNPSSQQVLTYILKNFVDSATRKEFSGLLRSETCPDSVSSIELLLSLLEAKKQRAST